jgi:hypothetical protein
MSDRQQMQSLGGRMPKDETGFKSAPSHYDGERETIDKQRDAARWLVRKFLPRGFMWFAHVWPASRLLTWMGDRAFCVHCGLTALKYADRKGRKPGTDDEAKRIFYHKMSLHAVNSADPEYPDPRADRPDFAPYVEDIEL